MPQASYQDKLGPAGPSGDSIRPALPRQLSGRRIPSTGGPGIGLTPLSGLPRMRIIDIRPRTSIPMSLLVLCRASNEGWGGTVWYTRPWFLVTATAWSTRPCHPSKYPGQSTSLPPRWSQMTTLSLLCWMIAYLGALPAQ